MSEERFDGMFLALAQQSEGIEPLLDNLFSFLRRKTDFFVGASQKQVEELVMKVVRKHASLSEKTENEKKLEREREEKKRLARLEKKRKAFTIYHGPLRINFHRKRNFELLRNCV